jgi:phage FluMu gp28-like protein
VSSWRADCTFEAIKNAAFERQLGYTYHQTLFSNMIRSGKLTRERALDRLNNMPENEQRLNAALELLNIERNGLWGRK